MKARSYSYLGFLYDGRLILTFIQGLNIKYLKLFKEKKKQPVVLQFGMFKDYSPCVSTGPNASVY